MEYAAESLCSPENMAQPPDSLDAMLGASGR